VKKRVLIVKRADMEFDIRCQRMASHLSNDYDITVIGTDTCSQLSVQQIKIADYDHARLSLPERAYRKFRREVFLRGIQDKPFEFRMSRDKWINELIKFFNMNQFELVIACDIDSISSFLNSNSKARLIGDMHEHAPTELANSPGWNERVGHYRKWQCKTYLTQVNDVLTVSPALARLFESEFKLSKVEVVRNVSPYHPRILPINYQPPRHFIHHGIAAPIRKLEEHIALASALGSEYSVSMLLKPVEFQYYNFLKDCEKVVRNFYLLSPVEPIKMISEIRKFDAGVYLLNPETPQLRVTLPNKFFEFIQARLPIFSGGLSEIDALIDQFGIGVKLGTFDGIEAAEVIKKSKDLDWKSIQENLDIAAKELSAEVEFTKVSRKIEELLSS
jgi:hypothetical protein